MPELSTGFFKARNGVLTGYGHSLFRIDLQNDSSFLVWSPSHAEYLTEGLHSINGITPDATREHLVWVCSTSACKVWAVDVRYKSAKIVVGWSLPSLSDDFGPQMAVTGIFGAGMLMSTPPLSSNMNKNDCFQCAQPPVMFSLKKDPGQAFCHVHQFPSSAPRFHTEPVELAGARDVLKVKYDVSCTARSAIFPLPDVSSDIFNIGLVTVQCSSKTALSEESLDQLGYQSPPNLTHVITMTCLGDMYAISLLETNAAEAIRAQQFPGLPVGTKAIPVPQTEDSIPSLDHVKLSLSNEFPVPSSAITPYTVKRQGGCCAFENFRDGPNQNFSPEIPLQGDTENEVKRKHLLPLACKKNHSVHELMNPNKATEDSTLHLVNRDVQSQDGTDEKLFTLNGIDSYAKTSRASSVKHPLQIFGFGLNIHAKAGGTSPPSSHMTAAITRNEEKVTNAFKSKESLHEDKRLNFLNNLERSYFNKVEGRGTSMKSEWSSDGE